jgi:hypothetical protein
LLTSFIQSSLIYTWMERIYDEIIYGLSYLYMQYQMMTEYLSRYIAFIISGNTNWWIWPQYTDLSLSTNPFLRQQRMEYYNTSTGTIHLRNSRNGSGMYFNNNNTSSLRSTKLLDLVEGMDDEIDDEYENSTSNRAAVHIHHNNTESTTTNIANHFDIGTTTATNSHPTMDIPVVGEQEQSHLVALRTSSSSDRLVFDPISNTPSWTWNNNHHHYDLEPAFVNERDYPSNWMVYHPILQRVILKVHADAYNQKMMFPEQHSSDHIVPRIGCGSNTETKSTIPTTSSPNTQGNGSNDSRVASNLHVESSDIRMDGLPQQPQLSLAKPPNEVAASAHPSGNDETATTVTNRPVVRQSVMAT